jgi:hypothetical protein
VRDPGGKSVAQVQMAGRAGGEAGDHEGQVSASFFEKKEAKKRLFTASRGTTTATAHRNKSFLVLFFKKERLSFVYRPPPLRRRAGFVINLV